MLPNDMPLTPHLFDPWSFLGPKRRRMLDQSWAGVFQREVLPHLPVEALAATFRADFGRPCKGLHTSLGVLVLQQMLDLTDDEAVQQLAFNEMWHYALGITDVSDEATTMSTRTLWSLRQKAIRLGLDQEMFETVTDRLVGAFGVGTGTQRLDSVRVQSNMRRLGRVGLVARTIGSFLRQLKRQPESHYERVPEAIRTRHEGARGEGVFAMVKPSAAAATLAELATEVDELYGLFAGDRVVESLKSFGLLARVRQEQCRVDEGPEGREVRIRPAREVPPDSLQNPSDPDAAYNRPKGQGYLVQLMETCVQDEGQPNLLTHVAVAPADARDSAAVEPALADVDGRGHKPGTLLADTAYGGDDNVQQAAAMGVELTAPVAGQAERLPVKLADFTWDDADRVRRCPLGQAPVSHREKGERLTALFPARVCAACPRRDDCPVKRGRSHYRLSYTRAARRSSCRRAREQTEAFRSQYRWRAGIEGTISGLDRRTGVKRLRVRGLAAVRFSVRLKALGLNILRVAAAQRVPGIDPRPSDPAGFRADHIRRTFSVTSKVVHVVKELKHLVTGCSRLRPIAA